MTERRIAQRFVVHATLEESKLGTLFAVQDEVAGAPALLLVAGPQALTGDDVLQAILDDNKQLIGSSAALVTYAAGRSEDGAWLASEGEAGALLDELLKRKEKLELPQLLRLGLALGRSVEAMAATDVRHLDLGPHRVWLGGDALTSGPVRVFGAGWWRLLPAWQNGAAADGFYGNPEYMAAEICKGQAAGPTADAYSAAMSLWALAAGKPPFTSAQPLMTLKRQAVEKPLRLDLVKPALKGVKDLQALLTDALDKDPAKRPAPAAWLSAIQALAGAAAADVAAETAAVPSQRGALFGKGAPSAVAPPAAKVEAAAAPAPAAKAEPAPAAKAEPAPAANAEPAPAAKAEQAPVVVAPVVAAAPAPVAVVAAPAPVVAAEPAPAAKIEAPRAPVELAKAEPAPTAAVAAPASPAASQGARTDADVTLKIDAADVRAAMAKAAAEEAAREDEDDDDDEPTPVGGNASAADQKGKGKRGKKNRRDRVAVAPAAVPVPAKAAAVIPSVIVTKAEPAKIEPAKVEPAKTEPPRAESAQPKVILKTATGAATGNSPKRPMTDRTLRVELAEGVFFSGDDAAGHKELHEEGPPIAPPQGVNKTVLGGLAAFVLVMAAVAGWMVVNKQEPPPAPTEEEETTASAAPVVAAAPVEPVAEPVDAGVAPAEPVAVAAAAVVEVDAGTGPDLGVMPVAAVDPKAAEVERLVGEGTAALTSDPKAALVKADQALALNPGNAPAVLLKKDAQVRVDALVKAEAEKKAADDKAGAEQKAADDKAAADKAAADKAGADKASADKAAADKAIADKQAASDKAAAAGKAQAEKKAAAEQKHQASDRAAADRKADADRKAAEKKAEAEQKAAEKKAAADKAASERARQAAEKPAQPDKKVAAEKSAAQLVAKRPPIAGDEAKKGGNDEASEAQQKASEYAGLAQKAAKPKLKVLYLQKAVKLDPANQSYRNLLKIAESELAAEGAQ